MHTAYLILIACAVLTGLANVCARRVGTRSLLFGVHQFAWHPFTVWLAWRRIYGKNPSWRECVGILVHDWGYWGCETMDGPDGLYHPYLGADIMSDLFDSDTTHGWRWFMLGHSRHLSELLKVEPSKLCWPDKCSMCFDPAWFYLARARWSGELAEYRANADKRGFVPSAAPDHVWLRKLTEKNRDLARAKAQEFKT